MVNNFYDRAAERIIIGTGLAHNVRDIESLREEWLGESRLRIIYRVMKDLRVAGLPTDVLTVMNELKNRGHEELVPSVLLAELVGESGLPQTVGPIIERVGNLWKIRTLKLASENFLNAEELGLMKQYQEEMKDVLNKNIKPPDVPATAGEAGERYWERLEKLHDKGDEEIVPTGFPLLDETADIRQKELTIIAARPSMGKSALALQMAYNAALEGKRTLYVSLEMPESGMMQRLFSLITDIPGWKLKKGNLSTDEWTRVAKALETLRGLPLHVSDRAMESVETIHQRVRYLKEFYGSCDAVYIDYMQLMDGVRKTDNRQQEVSDISRGLKKLAMEESLPVVALSQLSRAVEARQNKRPMLSDLRESGSLEQDGDNVFFIYRDEYYNPESLDRGSAELIIAKQRNGETTTVKLGYRASNTQFVNLHVATAGVGA